MRVTYRDLMIWGVKLASGVHQVKDTWQRGFPHSATATLEARRNSRLQAPNRGAYQDQPSGQRRERAKSASHPRHLLVLLNQLLV